MATAKWGLIVRELHYRKRAPLSDCRRSALLRDHRPGRIASPARRSTPPPTPRADARCRSPPRGRKAQADSPAAGLVRSMAGRLLGPWHEHSARWRRSAEVPTFASASRRNVKTPMNRTCNGLLQWCIGLCTTIGLALGSASAADAPMTLSFDWRATGTVTRWVQGSDQESTTSRETRGIGTITIVRDPSPDVRFALDFTSPAGGGSGVIPAAADQTVDPNFSFPSPLPPGLPPADSRALRGRFRRSGQERVPPSFQIIYTATFICRGRPESCGNVKRWDVEFIGNARSPSVTPRVPR